MTESNHLCDLWEHTVAKVLKHDPKSKLGLMNYPIDDFTPSGKFVLHE